MVYIFAIVMMLSSAMLFLIELMTAKALLPLFGGTAYVWTVCILFYQVVLLFGYIYAHYSSTYFNHKVSIVIQLIFVLCIMYFLTIEFSHEVPFALDESPVKYLILNLLITIGYPFFVLSMTSSTIQKWFERSGIKGSKDPYFLYGLSNFGSILALIMYPFFIEPNFTLKSQSNIITVMYYIFFALILFAGVFSAVHKKEIRPEENNLPEIEQDVKTIDLKRKIKWLILAFIPSGMMIAVTTYLSQEVAISPNPLLWSIPLLIYLITFIISFSKKPILKYNSLTKIFSIVLFIVPFFVINYSGTIIPLFVNFLLLLIVCLTCHGLLAQDRPNANNLTGFYITISLGGALGGVFISVISPLVFQQILEYPVILVIACFFIPYNWEKPFYKSISKFDFLIPFALGSFLLIFLLTENNITIAFLWVLIILIADKNPIRMATTFGIIYVAILISQGLKQDILLTSRDFYGVYKVTNNKIGFNALYHGNIIHGTQMTQKENEFEPTTYYVKQGPEGQFIDMVVDMSKNWSVALVGLGVGSSLGYKTENQTWTCYEISPKVIDIASDPKYFTFIEKFKPTIVSGDARLLLKTAKDNSYNLIILDAYSGDVIPVHLLTKEAFQLYLNKLTPDGVIIIHITNTTYDLKPVLASLSEELGLKMHAQYYSPEKSDKTMAGSNSEWCVMTNNREILKKIEESQKWKMITNIEKHSVWTDQYSSLLKIMRFR